MKKEDKELLLKDLSARTPYKVVAQVTYKDSEGWKTGDRKVLGVYTDGQVYVDCVYTNIENVKPYLRPMSSMTEEEFLEYRDIKYSKVTYRKNWKRFDVGKFHNVGIIPIEEYLDWLNGHHFDYRGLIERGLVLEAPEEMYDKE